MRQAVACGVTDIITSLLPVTTLKYRRSCFGPFGLRRLSDSPVPAYLY